jgi:hypothetical protein
MKRVLIVLVAVVASSGAFAQSNDAEIERALTPAPRNMKEGATVIHWKADGTYDTLKKGTNTMVCYDWSGQPGRQPFAVQCTSLGNLPREAQNLRAEATGDRAKSEAMLKEMEQNGTRAKPEFGSVWYHLSGADRDHVSAHEVTIAVPGATQASLGLPDQRRENGVWIMNAGTSTAHIMIPGR